MNDTELNLEKIPIILRVSRMARTIRISIKNTGAVTLTRPHRVSEKIALKFLNEKKDWITAKVDHFKKNPPVASVALPPKHYENNKTAALKLVQERINYINSHYKFEYKNVSVKNQRTRWGSCSKRGNLNFNYKILFLKPEEQDYIITHEICHLKELNHSKRFWALVAETVPDWKAVRSRMRKMHMQ